MSDVVLLKRGNNYCQTRLSAWKSYLHTYKPLNQLMVEIGQLEAWEVDREEKKLKAKLRRPYNG